MTRPLAGEIDPQINFAAKRGFGYQWQEVNKMDSIGLGWEHWTTTTAAAGVLDGPCYC